MTLIEILVSLVVLSLGLLGVAAMQGRGMQASHDAYLYSQATSLAYELAERIRINNTVPYATVGLVAAHPATACEARATPCIATAMASYDISSWLARVSLLPSGRGSVVSAAAGGSQTRVITIQWRGFGTPNCNSVGGETGRLEFTCFVLTVQQ